LLNIVFISEKQINNKTKIVVKRVCELLRENLELPKEIQIEFKELGDNVYAETSLNPRYNNRITLNSNLAVSEVIKPLVHELIHLEQINKGKLSKRRDGTYLFEGKLYSPKKTMSYKEYLELPWEYDVLVKEKILYKIILDKLGKQ